MMISLRPVVLLLCVVLVSLVLSTSAQTCRTQTFTNRLSYSGCSDLPVLNAFLHWNYNPANRTVTLAYRHLSVTPSTWVAWAINPQGRRMVGSQALVAYQVNGAITAHTSPVTSFGTTLQPGNLSFDVPSITAEYSNINNEITIFATLVLPVGTSTTVNQVWQDGPMNGNTPAIHSRTGANIQSVGTIDFQSGQSTGGGGGTNSRVKRRNVHGVLNAVSWGTLMPLGAIIARYLRVAKSADPAWFYLHIACQTSAYAVGVAGWATGLKLGSESVGVTYHPHRNIGIALFVLATLQVFALLLRPKPDHKFRFYWNIYHHLTGYLVIILSVVNVYKGFDILDPAKKWRRIYTGVLITLAAFAVLLEAFTWFVVIKRKKTEEKSHHGANGHQQGV